MAKTPPIARTFANMQLERPHASLYELAHARSVECPHHPCPHQHHGALNKVPRHNRAVRLALVYFMLFYSRVVATTRVVAILAYYCNTPYLRYWPMRAVQVSWMIPRSACCSHRYQLRFRCSGTGYNRFSDVQLLCSSIDSQMCNCSDRQTYMRRSFNLRPVKSV